MVNIDEPENKHFVEDFELVTKSLVLAEYQDGEVIRWENLKQVWQLVRDKERFLDYVRDSTRSFSRRADGAEPGWRWSRPCGWAS